MVAGIVPIELSVTAGDLVTLWAPRWRQGDEEWEAFLGDDEHLFAFPDVASLVGFVRSTTDHDLIDHPAWALVARLPAADLQPTDSHYYDLIGVPELVAQAPDTWVISELADVVAMVRSLAEVCELEVVHEVLAATPGFSLLEGGALAFGGREGERRWEALGTVIAQRWDEVIDAVDRLIRVPDVDPLARQAAAAELAELAELAEQAELAEPEQPTDTQPPSEQGTGAQAAAAGTGDPALVWWSQVGIDPIRIVSDLGDYYTLRCYVDDAPVFLGRNGSITVFTSARALARYLAENPTGHDLEAVSTWPQLVQRAQAGELTVVVDAANTYVLAGLAEDLAGGAATVDPAQLELAVELVTDAERWAGSDAADKALAGSQPLGWLVSFLLRPDPARLMPSPPFDAEVAAWRALTGAFEERLRVC